MERRLAEPIAKRHPVLLCAGLPRYPVMVFRDASKMNGPWIMGESCHCLMVGHRGDQLQLEMSGPCITIPYWQKKNPKVQNTKRESPNCQFSGNPYCVCLSEGHLSSVFEQQILEVFLGKALLQENNDTNLVLLFLYGDSCKRTTRFVDSLSYCLEGHRRLSISSDLAAFAVSTFQLFDNTQLNFLQPTQHHSLHHLFRRYLQIRASPTPEWNLQHGQTNMFRRRWSGLPEDPSFPADLEKLGYVDGLSLALSCAPSLVISLSTYSFSWSLGDARKTDIYRE